MRFNLNKGLTFKLLVAAPDDALIDLMSLHDIAGKEAAIGDLIDQPWKNRCNFEPSLDAS